MSDETRLDAAHAAMQAAPEDESARLAFHEALAASELFVLLESEAEGESITPRTVEAEGQCHVLTFDREDRLAQFAGEAAPYVALSGRALADMLAGERLGLGLNLRVAPSETLLPAEAVAWLAGMLREAPAQREARLRELRPPQDLPEELLAAIDARLAGAAGLAATAYLAGVVYDSGAEGHMLAILDPVAGAEDALARAVSEAVRFRGAEPVALDVAFFRTGDAAVAHLARVGLRFDLPEPETAETQPGAAPGMDPARPPRLR